MALLLFEGQMRTVTTANTVVEQFSQGTLPKGDWTHRAHLTVGTWYVHSYGRDGALRRLRDGIRRLNAAHGGQNTATAGYHETITRAYVVLIADFLTTCRQGASAAECADAVLRSPLAHRDALLTYYSRRCLMSEQARREWVPPDVRTLSARILCCPTVLDGGPVYLRRYRAADIETLVPMLMDASLMKWAIEDRPLSWPEAEALLKTQFRATDAFRMGTICLAGTDEPIGFGGFRECRYLGTDDLEFGWVIGAAHQGKGYATALGRKLTEYALDVLRLPHVLATCHPIHAESEHILRDKLRMQFIREVRVGPHRRRKVYAAVARRAQERAAS
jgi:RimJ/RimL family protein N-acetyltransferase